MALPKMKVLYYGKVIEVPLTTMAVITNMSGVLVAYFMKRRESYWASDQVVVSWNFQDAKDDWRNSFRLISELIQM